MTASSQHSPSYLFSGFHRPHNPPPRGVPDTFSNSPCLYAFLPSLDTPVSCTCNHDCGNGLMCTGGWCKGAFARSDQIRLFPPLHIFPLELSCLHRSQIAANLYFQHASHVLCSKLVGFHCHAWKGPKSIHLIFSPQIRTRHVSATPSAATASSAMMAFANVRFPTLLSSEQILRQPGGEGGGLCGGFII